MQTFTYIYIYSNNEKPNLTRRLNKVNKIMQINSPIICHRIVDSEIKEQKGL